MICCKLWWKLEWSWGGIPLQSVKPSCSPPTSIMSLAVPHSLFCSRIHSPPRHIQILVPLPQSTALSSPWSLNPGPEAGTSQAVLSQKYDCTRWIHSTFDCELSALGMASLWARPALILLVERILNDRIWTELAGCLVAWCLKLSFILWAQNFSLYFLLWALLGSLQVIAPRFPALMTIWIVQDPGPGMDHLVKGANAEGLPFNP